MTMLVDLLAESGEIVQAKLGQMQANHLEDFEIIWQSILRNLGQDDAVWDWAMKKGLIWLETQWHRSWLEPEQRLVYIEALAVAPWNRKKLQYPPYLKGTGNALMYFARQRSRALGYQGRIGLHSLPTSENFYRRQNMSDYGEDQDKDNLRYFEHGILNQ